MANSQRNITGMYVTLFPNTERSLGKLKKSIGSQLERQLVKLGSGFA